LAELNLYRGQGDKSRGHAWLLGKLLTLSETLTF
jgi:hypothetical protein